MALATGMTPAVAATDTPLTMVTPWKRWANTDTFYRLEASGDISCYSLNHHDCRSGPLPTDPAAAAQPLVCGVRHQKEWGTTGYDTPGHWCNRAYAALFAEWRAHYMGSYGVLLAVTPTGEVMCESYGSRACSWHITPEDHRQIAAKAVLDCAAQTQRRFSPEALRLCFGQGSPVGPTDRTNLDPLMCGAMHKSAYGATGYDTPGHWCNAPRATPWVRMPLSTTYYRLEPGSGMSCYSEDGTRCRSGEPNLDSTKWRPRVCTPADTDPATADRQGPNCIVAYATLFADWRDHTAFGFNGLLATNVFGDTMCWSDGRGNCSTIVTPDPTSASVLSLNCGDVLKALTGVTGYDTPGHWCNTPRIVFQYQGKPVPYAIESRNAQGVTAADYAFPIPNWIAADELKVAAHLWRDKGQPLFAMIGLPVRTNSVEPRYQTGTMVIRMDEGAVTLYAPNHYTPWGPYPITQHVGEYVVGLTFDSTGRTDLYRVESATGSLATLFQPDHRVDSSVMPRTIGSADSFGRDMQERIVAQPGQTEIWLTTTDNGGSASPMLEHVDLSIAMKHPKSPR